MPHSSSGFGEIRVNRIYLVEKESAKETADGKLSLEGQESAPPTTVPMVTWLHGQIAGMQEGRVIPVTFRDKAERNGYYSVASANSDLTDYQGEVATATWSIELDRLGSEGETDIQSRLTGAVRQNVFSVTGTRWHSPAIGHYSYHTGSTIPSNHDRVTEDGTIRVYTAIPAGISPKWGCAPEDYLNGAVRLTTTGEVSTENQLEGVNRALAPTGWTLSNGLINVTPSATGGILTVGMWNSGAYKLHNWDIRSGGNLVNPWQTASVLRNDPEQIVLRLMAGRSSTSAGREVLDLTLRRGAQFVEGFLQVSEATTLRLYGTNTTASASAANGTVAATATDADGLRWCSGSSKAFTANVTNGGFSTTGSVGVFDFWIGATIGTGTASETDITALQNQYMGAMPEATYAVRR